MSSEWFRSLWTATGRNHRPRYWSVFVAVFVLFLFVSALGFASVETLGRGGAFIILPFLPLYIAALIVSLFNTIKRLHGIGLSGWWVLAVFGVGLVFSLLGEAGGAAATVGQGLLTLFDLAFYIGLGVWPGQKGPNRFGPQPGVSTAAVFD